MVRFSDGAGGGEEGRTPRDLPDAILRFVEDAILRTSDTEQFERTTVEALLAVASAYVARSIARRHGLPLDAGKVVSNLIYVRLLTAATADFSLVEINPPPSGENF